MNELINVKNENGELLVSARELHKGLEIESKYNDWIKRMIEYGFEENIDYIIINEPTQKKEGSRIVTRRLDTHILKIDTAKEICMIQRNDKGREFRKYFIECEKRLKEQDSQPKLPTTYKEALQQLLIQIEENEKLQESKNKLIHQGKLYNTTEIAKELGFKSAQALNKDLELKNIQYRTNGTWVLCARYSEKGFVSIKQNELENGKIIYDRKWTGIGRDFLLELYNNK